MPLHIVGCASERSCMTNLSKVQKMIRAHRPDGIMIVKQPSTFPFKRGDTILEELPLTVGQQIALEVELSQKEFA